MPFTLPGISDISLNASQLFKKKKQEQQQAPTSSLYSTPANKSQSTAAPYSSSTQNRSVMPSTSSSVGPRSVAPQTMGPTQIQGSGMSGKYASNPSNYKPASTPAPAPMVKPAQPAQQQQSQVDPSAAFKQQIDEDYKRRQQLADELMSGYNKSYEETSNLQDDMLKQTIGDLLGMKGSAQGQFDQFASDTRQGVENLKAAAARNKEGVQDYYGEAQRKAASARRDTQADASRRFASLNTVDSFGEGSYGRAQENIDSEFNRVTAQYAKEAANKMAQIDDSLFAAQQQAETAVRNEQMKLQDVFRNIDSQIANGSLQNRAAKQQAYQQFQQSIMGIKENMLNLQSQAEQQKMSIQQQMEQMNSEQFTPEFMSTGVPTNQKEYEFFIKNSGAYKDLYGFGDQQQGAQGATQKPLSGDAAKLVGLSESALQSIAALRNKFQNNEVGITSSYTDRNYQYNSNNLIDAIGRLRSGGAIGPEEAANLSKLVPSYWDDEATRNQKLAELEREFRNITNSVGSQGQQGQMSNDDPLGLGF